MSYILRLEKCQCRGNMKLGIEFVPREPVYIDKVPMNMILTA